MKYRDCEWFDTEQGKPYYGIQGNEGDGWKHLAENGKPLIYESFVERDAKLKELREQDRA